VTAGSTAYRYLHEGIDVLAALAPDLATAISAAKAALTAVAVRVAETQRVSRHRSERGPSRWLG
jgi:hypothetical protein